MILVSVIIKYKDDIFVKLRICLSSSYMLYGHVILGSIPFSCFCLDMLASTAFKDENSFGKVKGFNH